MKKGQILTAFILAVVLGLTTPTVVAATSDSPAPLADASAKSSVSIMAGVSSFITAAGSALVAIRRGKKA